MVSCKKIDALTGHTGQTIPCEIQCRNLISNKITFLCIGRYIARILWTARYLMLELTVWQVILKQADTRDFPKYPMSHPVLVIAMTRLNI